VVDARVPFERFWPWKTLSTKIKTATAIRHALARYLDYGEVEIDNNAADRALLVVALGRKNDLFAGSNRGGERAPSALLPYRFRQAQRPRPARYLRRAQSQIAEDPVDGIVELLPWNITKPAAR
jgi:hypothetical protein